MYVPKTGEQFDAFIRDLVQAVERMWPEVRARAGLSNDPEARAEIHRAHDGLAAIGVWSGRKGPEMDVAREELASGLEHSGYVIERKPPQIRLVQGLR